MQSSNADLHEVRLYGLNISITTDALGEFLGKGVRVRGILLHPPAKGAFQWAQVWVGSEAEVVSLLGLRDALAVNGITISRVNKVTSVTPPQSSWDLVSQISRISRPGSVPAFSLSGLSGASPGSVFGRSSEVPSSLPRNLYILNLPLDLTQIEFKDFFTPFGMVEHSILLSQLDGIGRRRGFVLMSQHSEALEVMHHMHGKWIDGFKLDVSWALVQRETKNMPNSTLPNRVVHPPAIPTRREPSTDCAVILDNLDPGLFPDADTVSSIFRSFGPIYRVVKLTESSVMIQFEHAVSALSLINANGLRLGDRTLSARGLGMSTAVESVTNSFDPFADASTPNWLDKASQPQLSRATRLNADSQPFVPSFMMQTPRESGQQQRDMQLSPAMVLEKKLSQISLSKLSVGSASPNKSHSSGDVSIGGSSKSQRSETTVVGDE